MKKKRETRQPPVPTEHDARGKERSAADSAPERDAKAPDGISGDWG
ncbi:MAG: hypothetical protein IJK63_02955 [Oscillospiraceae bacterium]|nr:hypothetical protein [Oscillospiraceae bacterium]